jgi:hypothetical protein
MENKKVFIAIFAALLTALVSLALIILIVAIY